jgi:hypothetical protein
MGGVPTQPPQEPALQQLGVEPVGFRSAMLPRYRDTRGMDHVSLYSTRRKPARQPEPVAAGFEGKRNPRDRAAGPDRRVFPSNRPPGTKKGSRPLQAAPHWLVFVRCRICGACPIYSRTVTAKISGNRT